MPIGCNCEVEWKFLFSAIDLSRWKRSLSHYEFSFSFLNIFFSCPIQSFFLSQRFLKASWEILVTYPLLSSSSLSYVLSYHWPQNGFWRHASSDFHSFRCWKLEGNWNGESPLAWMKKCQVEWVDRDIFPFLKENFSLDFIKGDFSQIFTHTVRFIVDQKLSPNWRVTETWNKSVNIRVGTGAGRIGSLILIGTLIL